MIRYIYYRLRLLWRLHILRDNKQLITDDYVEQYTAQVEALINRSKNDNYKNIKGRRSCKNS